MDKIQLMKRENSKMFETLDVRFLLNQLLFIRNNYLKNKKNQLSFSKFSVWLIGIVILLFTFHRFSVHFFGGKIWGKSKFDGSNLY